MGLIKVNDLAAIHIRVECFDPVLSVRFKIPMKSFRFRLYVPFIGPKKIMFSCARWIRVAKKRQLWRRFMLKGFQAKVSYVADDGSRIF